MCAYAMQNHIIDQNHCMVLLLVEVHVHVAYSCSALLNFLSLFSFLLVFFGFCYTQEFGEPTSKMFRSAQKSFVESCAAYCLLCYFIQIKDRYMCNCLSLPPCLPSV